MPVILTIIFGVFQTFFFLKFYDYFGFSIENNETCISPFLSDSPLLPLCPLKRRQTGLTYSSNNLRTVG